MQGSKEPFSPLKYRKLRKIVVRCRKVFYFFEFRHREELTVQVKPPAMIFATYVSEFAGFLNNQISAMCTDIGEAMDSPLFVFGEHQRLMDEVLQVSEGCYPTRIFNLVCIPNKLPGTIK